MKRLLSFALCLCLCLLCTQAFAGTVIEKAATITEIFTAEAITAGSSVTSDAITIRNAAGYFAMQSLVTGDGTVTYEMLISIDGTNFLEPSDFDDIASGVTKTSGPGSDGKDIYSFSPCIGKQLKIKATETGGVSAVAITCHIIIQ